MQKLLSYPQRFGGYVDNPNALVGADLTVRETIDPIRVHLRPRWTLAAP